jgi:VWFA-related protein
MLKRSAYLRFCPAPAAAFILFFLASLLAAAPFALAQNSTPPKPDAPAPAAQKPEDDQTPTLKVSVNVVGLFFNVKDKHGALIPNLTKDDFEVSEDGKAQTIKYFAAESNLPLTLGILIDSSGSQLRVLDMEKEVGGAFLRQILTDKDEAYIIDFNVDASLIQDYTRDVHRLQTALNKVKINTAFTTGPIPGAGGGPVPTAPGSQRGTVLYDAVYLSAHDMLAKEVGRKAMILLTDGEDEGSDHKIGEAIAAAQKSNAIVYVILIADRGFYGGFGYSGYSAMKKLTEETGGRLIDVGNNGKKLEAAFQQIEDELRTQYVATYTSTNNKLDGSFRHLDVSCKGDGMKVQTRKGYYAMAPQE